MPIAIRVPCTEFGRTFTVGQIVSLGSQQEIALIQSGLAEFTGTQAGTHVPGMPSEGLVPITSVMFANPRAYNFDQYPQRIYVFEGFHYIWSGSALSCIGAGAEVTVTVLPGEVTALNATPKLIVPASLANIAIVVSRVVVHKPAGAAYGGIAAGEDLTLRYTNGSGAQVCAAIETTGFLDQTTAQTRIAHPPSTIGATGDFSLAAAAPVVLHMLAGEVTGAGAPLHVRVRYDLVQVAFTA